MSLSLQARIETQIGTYYKALLEWMQNWEAVVDNPTYSGRIHFTTYEEMHGNEERFISKLIGHFCGAHVRPKVKLPEKNMQSHFRSGKLDEWREVFTAEQTDRTTEMISPQLRTRFEWS